MKFPVSDLPVLNSYSPKTKPFDRLPFTETCIKILARKWSALAKCERLLHAAGERNALLFVRSELEDLADLFARLETRAIMQSIFRDTTPCHEVKGDA